MAENRVQEKVVAPPAGGTAVVSVAIGLAVLGVLAAVLGAINAVHTLAHGYSAGFMEFHTVRPRGWLRGYYRLAAVADPSAAVLLAGGVVLVIVRRRWGQILLTAGCVVVIVASVFGAAVKPDLFGAGPAGLVDRVVYLAPLAFPIATAVLAWSPPATRRCRPAGGVG